MKNLQPHQLVRINSDLWPSYNGLYSVDEGTRTVNGCKEYLLHCVEGYNKGEIDFLSEKFLNQYATLLSEPEREEVFNERVRRFREANRKGIIAQYGSMKAFKEASHG